MRRNIKKETIKLLSMTAIFLVIPMLLSNQTIFAGQQVCQTGAQQNPPCRVSNCEQNCIPNPELPACLRRINSEQQQFAAAQTGYEQNQPPTAGNLTGGDSAARSTVSYFASVFFLLGGIWLLISILRERWLKRFAPKSARLARFCDFALKPQFALSMFAVLFAAVIAGSILTSPPTITSAQQQREQTEQTNVNPGLSTNQPVFKSARQIGGDGVTQIGAPVYDGYGNYYVQRSLQRHAHTRLGNFDRDAGMDLFFAKYDADGNLLWARHGSGITSAPSDDLAVEGATAMAFNGYDLYIAGSFVKTLTLPGGANPSITLNDNGAAGYNYETFFAKYDQNGNLIWARGGNSNSPKKPDNLETGQNTINKILFDRSGLPYVAGIISGGNFLGVPISNFTCSNVSRAR